MGLDGPKSLLEVRDGLTFLDVVARQVLALRERTGARLPLVLMNSFSTREPSLERLARYPELAVDGLAMDFLQNKEPKLAEETLQPVSWAADPALEWAPPGHGDLYPALVSSGMLAQLLERGYRYAFVANVDNLGAVLDPRILGWMAREQIPFLMEVADRTPADRKGGHLARRRSDGGLVLREIAQTRDEDVDAFQDIERHRYFNTNNLWLDLQALDARLREGGGVLALPMIVNRKTVDPRDGDSTAVVQLETAMGAAIGVFDGARALRVPRRRFAPVKTTNDLLGLRSDAFVVDEAWEVTLAPQRSGPPIVDLDAGLLQARRRLRGAVPGGRPVAAGLRRAGGRRRRGLRRRRRRARSRPGREPRRRSAAHRRRRRARALDAAGVAAGADLRLGAQRGLGWAGGQLVVGVAVALPALLLALGLVDHPHEQPHQRDAHDDRLLQRHDQRRRRPGRRWATAPSSRAGRHRTHTAHRARR